MNKKSLNDAIKSYDKLIKEHENKIKEEKSKALQNPNIINYWEKEVVGFKNNRKKLLEKRKK